jgi:hypothetical protein
MTKEQILKIRGRAISTLCTYTPSEAKMRIDASDVKALCDRALKAKVFKFNLKVKKE